MTFSFFRSLLFSFSIFIFIPVVSYAGFGFDGRRDGQQKTMLEEPSSIVPMSIIEHPPEMSHGAIPMEPVAPDRPKKPVLQVYSKDTGHPMHHQTHPVPIPIFKHINVETWKADQGESLRDVIRRWSGRAGVDLVWAVEDRRTVMDSVSYFGGFEGALTHLFDTGMQGTVEGELSYLESSSTNVDIEKMVPYAKVKAMSQITGHQAASSTPNLKVEQKWKAEKNESLNKVLRQWQSSGHYELIWDYPFDIMVPNSFFAYGKIEDALALLLDQYTQEGNIRTNMRPVGDMYRDPKSGMLYLHVKKNL